MSVRVERLPMCPPLNPDLPVKITTMSDIVEIQYLSTKNFKQTIKVLPGGKQYVVCSTGEVKDTVTHENRAALKSSLNRTFTTLRRLIYTNVTDVKKVRWITLTFANDVRDLSQVYREFSNFNKRFQYYIKKLGYGKAEYIAVCEPTARGRWHIHLLYIFDRDAPFIPNTEFSKIWKLGFTKIKQLKNADNIGAYLTSYLTDVPLDELTGDADAVVKALDYFGGDKVGYGVKEVKGKKYVKGARLGFYPLHARLFRTSRGVQRPITEMTSQKDAREKVKNGKLTYEKTVRVVDKEKHLDLIINKRQYNLKANNNVP